MWWRSTRRQFEQRKGEGNRRAFKALVDAGVIPGIVGILDDEPVAWCSVAPREQFGALNRSPILRSVDDASVWSIVCFYVAPSCRGQGLLGATIRAAVEYARRQGGHVVEAYPRRPRGRRLASVSSFMGVPSEFEAEGFAEVARPSVGRSIVRFVIDSSPRRRGEGRQEQVS
jgi:GNAT superfamily N-acetyltransferase